MYINQYYKHIWKLEPYPKKQMMIINKLKKEKEYRENNKEKIRGHIKKYIEKNEKNFKEYQKDYNLKHKKERNEYYKKYNKERRANLAITTR